MNKEEIKKRIDFKNVQEKNIPNDLGIDMKIDYLVDFEGNFIVPLSPLDVKLIEKIKELELRIKKLEGK